MQLQQAHTAGIVLGVGLGGFVDGIVLHMILRWHHMLSNVVSPATMPGMHYNMTWDGYFHALCWVITLGGIFLLWRVAQQRRELPLPSTRSFTGALVAGWGLFNLVEGLLDHQWLRLHNVREVPNPWPWNIGFLLVGGVMLLALGGWLMTRAPRRAGREGETETGFASPARPARTRSVD